MNQPETRLQTPPSMQNETSYLITVFEDPHKEPKARNTRVVGVFWSR